MPESVRLSFPQPVEEKQAALEAEIAAIQACWVSAPSPRSSTPVMDPEIRMVMNI